VNTNPLVCVTVTAPTVAELRQARDAAADADLVELRLDTVRDPSVAAALAGRRRPVIVTCRSRAEGGQFQGSEEERRRILGDALALGAEYVDVEWRAGFDDLLTLAGGRRIVLSYHDFDGMPADLPGIARAMRSAGADIIKIAGKARRLSDCVSLMELGASIGRQGNAVLIAMGEAGLVSRILAGRFGSLWTYTGPFSGIGQLTPTALLDEYRFRHINANTRLYGLVGSPISHSVSPAMHNAAFRAARIDAVYLPLPATDAEDFTRFAHAFGVKGASVTIPFKVPLYERVDEADSVARRIGAINTLRMDDGRWLGANTDAAGFLQPLGERAVLLRGTRAAILGAGGSARAVAVALASSGAEVTVYARDRAKAEDVALLVGAAAGDWPPAPGSWDLAVNCTPVGMHPRVDSSPLPATALTGRWVYDLVYNPPLTQLLHDAELAGCRTIGGLDMLVAQAHEQFHWWTNMRPAAGVMRSAALRRLSEFASNENHVV
jgi:3-dehydroquinate dehydratase/shikimate dehydrogenase